MKTSELVFIGIKGSVIALNRATAQAEWATHLKGSDFVNLVLQPEAILASCYGEIFCLDPLTGNARWHNPLKGFGIGLATIACLETSKLVYAGIKRSVIALNRATGEQVWATQLKRSGFGCCDFVNIVVEARAILAAYGGEIFCLDPLSGNALWHNPLKGFGIGLATIATEAGAGGGPTTAAMAEKRRRDQQAAASGATAAA